MKTIKDTIQKSVNKFFIQFKIRIKEIFNSDLTAKQIAINFTVGILMGLLIPMGLQTIAVVLICALFKFNFVIVVFATLISNPFTVVFVYYSAFKIGEIFNNSVISWNHISEVTNNPDLESLLSLSLDSLKLIYTGLLIEAIVICSLTYVLVFYFAKYVRNKKLIKSSVISQN